MAVSSIPLAISACFIDFTIALQELTASEPPLKTTAFPLLKQMPNESAVTLGLAS